MKLRIPLLSCCALAAVLGFCGGAVAQMPPAKKAAGAHRRISPHDTASAVVGGNRVMIVYGRPYTRDFHYHGPPANAPMRTVWGGELVPLDDIWRLGADEATLLITAEPLKIGKGSDSVRVPRGVCSLYLFPQTLDDVNLVVNKQYGQWGLEYHDDSDIGRVKMEKSVLPEPVHQFTIVVQPTGPRTGVIRLQWEALEYSVPFTVETSALDHAAKS